MILYSILNSKRGRVLADGCAITTGSKLIMCAYSSISKRKRERAKDYVCAMIADCFVDTGVLTKDESLTYVNLFAKPLAKHRNNYVYINLWKALYIPMIKLTLSKKVLAMAWVATGIVGEFRRVRDSIKLINRLLKNEELTDLGKRVFAANMSFAKRDGYGFVLRKFGKGSEMYKTGLLGAYNMFIKGGFHPAMNILLQNKAAVAEGASMMQSWFKNNILDSRVKPWTSDQVGKLPLFNTEMFGRKRLSQARLNRLSENRKVFWLYLLVRILFDRENNLKWNWVLSSELKVQLELSEAGLVMFNAFIKGSRDGKPMTFEYRPAVIQRLGPVWKLLPVDIGYVPKRGRGSRWLTLSGLEMLNPDIPDIPNPKLLPDDPKWGAWMLETFVNILGNPLPDPPAADRLSEFPRLVESKIVPPGAQQIIRARIAANAVQKQQQDRFLSDMMKSKEQVWAYNFDNLSTLFRGKIRHRR